jgi:hypothetical protein
MFAYQERNNQPGFQYKVGDFVWSCAVNNGLDCIVDGSFIDFKKDISWSQVTTASQTCVSALSSTTGYNNTCTIFQVTTTGSYLGASAMTITLTLASQKILLKPTITATGVEIGPDVAKFDLVIRYPWVQKLVSKTTSYVALLAGAAGKASSGVVAGGQWQGKSSSVWYFDKDRAAVLSWDGSATINSGSVTNPVPVFVQGISGASILAYNCTDTNPAICLIQNLILTPWKIVAGLLTGFGWTPELVILSWPQLGPDTITHDPIYGSASSTEIKSGSLLFTPTLFLYFIWAIVHYFYRR